ncbi:hypothetical protein T484DRAFT_1912379 [Baffinella frigidus]|nr:hypothetical protein T484DRAFT_1912379 [Cryptophyta sp. CCMP2293]
MDTRDILEASLLKIHKELRVCRDLGDSSKSVPMHIDEDVHGTPRLGDDVHESRRVSDFLRLCTSCPSPMRQQTLEFEVRTVRVPDLAWLDSTDEEDVEEPAAPHDYCKTPPPPRAPPREPETIQGPSCEFLPKVARPDFDLLNSTEEDVEKRATPRVYRKTPIRPRAPPEHLKIVSETHKKFSALGDSSKSEPMHIDEEVHESRRVSDFLRLCASRPRTMRQPTLEVRTVRVPDLAWLDSTEEEDVEEPVSRKTPIRPRAPPPRPFEQKAEQHGGRTWEEYTAVLTRLLQSAPRAETCVWRLGDAH